MNIEELENLIKQCEKCPLHKTVNNYVIGDGNIHSKIMIIGEAPGEQEDLQGKVFIGPSGKLLDKMLSAISLDRTKVYITNIMKCRPPHNRNPLKQEINECLDYLRQQYIIMQPKIILLLGSVACKTIIDQNFSLMNNHGKIIYKKDVYFVPTFHPSALLRDESKKQLAWQDLKILQQLIKEKL